MYRRSLLAQTPSAQTGSHRLAAFGNNQDGMRIEDRFRLYMISNHIVTLNNNSETPSEVETGRRFVGDKQTWVLPWKMHSKFLFSEFFLQLICNQ